MEQIKKEKIENRKNLLCGGYKKSLRIFFTLGIATTLAFGLTGCGNSEAPAEEAEVTEEVETEENNTQEIIGEDSTDTLTIDELLAGIGAVDIDEVWNNQEALDFLANWMEQNGYYDIQPEFWGDVPVCEAYAILQSDGSEMFIQVQLLRGVKGMFAYSANNEDGELGELIVGMKTPELPSALGLNEIIEQN